MDGIGSKADDLTEVGTIHGVAGPAVDIHNRAIDLRAMRDNVAVVHMFTSIHTMK